MLKVKSNVKRQKVTIKTHCPTCANRAIKILKLRGKYAKRHKCTECGNGHILTIYGMTGLDIAKALPDVEFDFIGEVH